MRYYDHIHSACGYGCLPVSEWVAVEKDKKKACRHVLGGVAPCVRPLIGHGSSTEYIAPFPFITHSTSHSVSHHTHHTCVVQGEVHMSIVHNIPPWGGRHITAVNAAAEVLRPNIKV